MPTRRRVVTGRGEGGAAPATALTASEYLRQTGHLDPRVEGQIIAALQRGNSLRHAAEAFGLAEGQLTALQDEDPEFDAACRQARAEGQIALRQKMFDSGDPSAHRWLLENGYKESDADDTL
jgi:hypothetical protein